MLGMVRKNKVRRINRCSRDGCSDHLTRVDCGSEWPVMSGGIAFLSWSAAV